MARGCGCFLPLAMTVFGFGFGIQALGVYAASRQPTPVRCAQLAERPPDAAWIALRECHFDHRTVVEASHGGVERVWVPLHAGPFVPEAPVRIVAEIVEPALLDGVTADASVVEASRDTMTELLAVPRPADSLGLDARKALSDRGVTLAGDLMVVRSQSSAPSLGPVLAWLLLGMVGIGGLMMTVLSVWFPTHEADGRAEPPRG